MGIMQTKTSATHLNINISRNKHSKNQSVNKKLTLISAAKRRLSLVGSYSSNNFPEIAKISEQTQIEINLAFYLKDEIIGVKGSIIANLIIQCQRCLLPMPVLLNCNTELVFDLNEQDNPNNYDKVETILVLDNYVDMVNVISDEILLTLPLSPRHLEDCQLIKNNITHSVNATYKPFAQLEQIRKQNQ